MLPLNNKLQASEQVIASLHHSDSDNSELTNTSSEYLLKNNNKYTANNKIDANIFYALDKLLHKEDFDIMNSKLWFIKALLYAATPFFCGINSLIIAKTGSITANLVLATQFTVPRTIECICFLIDQARIGIHEGQLKQWFKDIPTHKIITCWQLIRLVAGIYLGYAYALIDAKTSGDAARWLFTNTTSNEHLLNIAKYTGYTFNFIYTALLGAIFFYQLIDELIMRLGIGRAIGITPLPIEDIEYEQHMQDVQQLRNRCQEFHDQQQTDITVENYLADRNINSTHKIATLQRCLAGRQQPNSWKQNLTINMLKLLFIAGATVICGASFKYIFASETILRNYVNIVGTKQHNGRYIFPLKNGDYFSCNSVDSCTKGVDFSKINITATQKDQLLDLSKTANLAYTLQGISMSADTAVLMLSFAGVVYSLIESKLYRRAYKIALTTKAKLKPTIANVAACLIAPAMVCYLANVYDVKPVAETANSLLETIGQKPFVPVGIGIIATMSVLGVTFCLGARLLYNIPSAIIAIQKKCCKHAE